MPPFDLHLPGEPERLETPLRGFRVSLRWQDGPFDDEPRHYRWSGPATDEAHALVLAKAAAADDGWNAEHDASYHSARVVEEAAAIPVTFQFGATDAS